MSESYSTGIMSFGEMQFADRVNESGVITVPFGEMSLPETETQQVAERSVSSVQFGEVLLAEEPMQTTVCTSSSNNLSNTVRNVRRRQRYDEQKAEAQAIVAEEKAVADYSQEIAAGNYQEADAIFHEKLVGTKTGEKLFPISAKKDIQASLGVKISENITKYNHSAGQRSKHRGQIMLRITEGIPPLLCQQYFSVDPAYLRKQKSRQNLESSSPAIVRESRDESGGRRSVPEALEQELLAFFFERSHIESGAKTHTRIVTSTLKQLGLELYAASPGIYRKVAQKDPDLRPKHAEKRLTRLEMNILAAEHQRTQGNFSEGEEYRTRLAEAIQR